MEALHFMSLRCLLAIMMFMLTGCHHQPTQQHPSETNITSAAPAKKKLVAAGPNRDYAPPFSGLLANPEHFHGRRVQLKGFLTAEFEGTALYLTRDHAEHGISAEGVWVEFNDIPKELHFKWVLIEATFDKDERGHMGSWSGGLKDIERIYELQSERK